MGSHPGGIGSGWDQESQAGACVVFTICMENIHRNVFLYTMENLTEEKPKQYLRTYHPALTSLPHNSYSYIRVLRINSQISTLVVKRNKHRKIVVDGKAASTSANAIPSLRVLPEP